MKLATDWAEVETYSGEEDSKEPLEWGEALKKSIVPCTELESLGIPKRQSLLGDWFMEGDLGFIFAPRGLGKTWLSLAMATAISKDGKCGPWRANNSHRVLYVDGEMPAESLYQRIQGMGGMGETLTVLNHEALFHRCNKVLNLANPELQSQLTAWLVAEHIRVLFLDNLSCLFSGIKENEADAWESVLQWLLTLRRHRIAVVIVHHAGRNPQTMRGTSRREDAAFWVIRLEAVEGDEKEGARFLSTFTKDRNSRREQPALEWLFRTEEGHTVIEYKEASELDALLKWVKMGLDTAGEIAKEMGVTAGTVSKMAHRAIEAGRLKKEGRKYVLPAVS